MAIIITDKKTTVAFAKEDPRSACNGKTVFGKAVEYVPTSNYKGTDEVVIEAVSSAGGMAKDTFRITVK